jgi:Cu/Ag efflux pump CusA
MAGGMITAPMLSILVLPAAFTGALAKLDV